MESRSRPLAERELAAEVCVPSAALLQCVAALVALLQCVAAEMCVPSAAAHAGARLLPHD